MSNVTYMEENRAIPHAGGTINAIAAKRWSILDCLSELIDNAFGEGRGNAKTVRIRWSPGEGVNGLLEIYDNGRGIDRMVNLFRYGEGKGASGGYDLGVHGVGGTEAIAWLSHTVEVVTIRESDKMTCAYKTNWERDWKENFPIVNPTWETIDGYNVKNDEMRRAERGTLIRLWLREGHAKPNAESLKAKIAERYAPALLDGKTITWQTVTNVDSKRRREAPIEALIVPPSPLGEKFSDVVFVQTPLGELPFEIEVQILTEDDMAKPGISIECGPRIVIDRTESDAFFFDRENDRRFAVNNVVGRARLTDPRWPKFLSKTKEGFRPEASEIEKNFYALGNAAIKHVLERAERLERVAILSSFGAHINDMLTADIEPELPGGDDDGDYKGDEGREVEVETAAKWKKREHNPNPDPVPRDKPEVTTRKYPWMKPTDTKREGAKTKRRVHVAASHRGMVTWFMRTDDEMHGQWASVTYDRVSRSMTGFLNEECPIIANGFRSNASSQHKRELLLVVLNEIAETISRHPEFAEHIFPKHYAEWLEFVEDDARSVSIRRLIAVELAQRSRAFGEL